MSRTNTFAAALLVAAFAALALADDGLAATSMGNAQGPKTRDEVKAELAAAIRDGTFAKMNHNRSYSPEFDIRSRTGTRSQAPVAAAQTLQGSGEIAFEAPAAGVRTRAEVLLEVQRAREDGSLRRMGTNRGY